jgi:hypothetical protein
LLISESIVSHIVEKTNEEGMSKKS